MGVNLVFCGNCGAPRQPAAQFCGRCGQGFKGQDNSLNSSTAAPADTQAPGVGQAAGSVSRRRPELRWLGTVISGLAAIVFFGSQIYVFIYTLGVMNATWGLVGVLALFFIPPLWFVTPFIAWVASGQFPTTFFVVWLGGWIGGGILFALGGALRGD